MQVTVLGSGAAFPRPGGACSGYLVERGDTRVWLEAGNGTFARLRERVGPQDLSALVLTHDHADHIADVLLLMYELGYDGHVPLPTRVPVYATDGVAPKLLGLIGPGSTKIFRDVFDFRPIASPFEVGGMAFEPFRTLHPTETYGLVVSADGRRLVYTSDTAAFPELAAHCRDADVLICEATYVGDVDVEPGVHMWAREAGELAAAAGARKLILTHVWASFDPQDAVREAAERFDGPIEAAVEGRTYEIS